MFNTVGESAKGRCTAQIQERLELVLFTCAAGAERQRYLLHTGAGRGAAGGSWQQAGAAQPQAAREDLSPQAARGGEEGCGKLGSRETHVAMG